MARNSPVTRENFSLVVGIAGESDLPVTIGLYLRIAGGGERLLLLRGTHATMYQQSHTRYHPQLGRVKDHWGDCPTVYSSISLPLFCAFSWNS